MGVSKSSIYLSALISLFSTVAVAQPISRCGDAELSQSERNAACDIVMEMGVFDQALTDALDALALSPSDASALTDLHDLNLIVAQRLGHNPNSIISYSTVGINHTDTIAELYLLRSNGHRVNGDLTLEIADIERARSISKLSTEYSVRLIEAYVEANDLVNALDQANTLVTYVAPNGQLEMEMRDRKVALEASGDTDGVDESFQQFMSKLEQNYQWAVSAKMEIYFALADYPAALQVNDDLLKITDDPVHALWFRGVILRQGDRFEDALAAFDMAFEAIELSQLQVSSVRYQSLLALRGEVLVFMGMSDAALRDFEELFRVADVSMFDEIEVGLEEHGHITRGPSNGSNNEMAVALISCVQDIVCSTSIHRILEVSLAE